MSAPLILASGSATRLRLLRNAGLTVEAVPAAIDEGMVKESLRAEGASVADVAQELAHLKAERVSRRLPGAMVLGADQMLDCGGTWFDKPEGRAGAATQLLSLAGRTHKLISGLAIHRDGASIWTHRAVATLTMRPLTPAQVETYLDQTGESVFSSVGAYHIEGLGLNLFEKIDGDFFTIQGLPMLPLLAFLRVHTMGLV